MRLPRTANLLYRNFDGKTRLANRKINKIIVHSSRLDANVYDNMAAISPRLRKYNQLGIFQKNVRVAQPKIKKTIVAYKARISWSGGILFLSAIKV